MKIKVNKSISKGFHTGSLCFILLLLFLNTLSSQTTETVTIIGTGDMMLGTNYPNKSYLPANGGRDLLKAVENILKNADVTFGNLEGCMFDGTGTPKRCRDMSKCYVFRSPASFVNHFVNAGYDVVSLANNHSGDFGLAGRKGTKKVLDDAGIAYAGLASTDESTVFERNGVKYGFAAFAPNSGTCDVRNLSRAKQIVAGLAAKCDIVIVSFHGGAEGKAHQHVPKKTEYYLGENRGNVHAFAHAVIDAGADVVFGHGPHVTRAVEVYKDRFIAYSLGNFCTYGRFNLTGASGVAPIIKVHASPSGEFVRAEVFSTYQQKSHGPKPDPQNRALKIIRELTRADFPDAGLAISDDGLILPKE